MHIHSPHQVGAVVVSPLFIAQGLAIILELRGITHIPRFIIDQGRRARPIPGLLCPLGVGVVVGVPGQACSQLEESPVGNGVLHRITRLIREQLPAQSTATGAIIPPVGLRIEDTLRQGEPRVVALDVGEFPLGGAHRSETPEGLVIVTLDVSDRSWLAEWPGGVPPTR